MINTMYEKILIPTDGSETAEAAIDHAVDLAEQYGAELHGLYVVDKNAVSITLGSEQVDRLETGRFDELPEVKQRAEDALDVVSEKADQSGLAVTGEIRIGQPQRVIRDYIEDEDIDLVVMGSAGRGGIRRQILGSVTERVLRSTDVPVLVVDIKGKR